MVLVVHGRLVMAQIASVVPSYASGTSGIPLLGDTIGDNFDRTVAAYGGRDALVDRPARELVGVGRIEAEEVHRDAVREHTSERGDKVERRRGRRRE